MQESLPATSKPRLLVRVMTAVFIACRHLLADRKRFALNVLGLGVAAMLVMFMQGVVQWINVSTTSYLDNTKADLVVTVKGLNDFMFSQSAFPSSVADVAEQTPGVAKATPITVINGVLSSTGKPLPVFVVGSPVDSSAGVWSLVSGRSPRADNEIVLDRDLATNNHFQLGDTVELLDHDFRVVGFSKGTNAAGIFFVFTTVHGAQQTLGGDFISDILVTLQPGVSEQQVIDDLDTIPGVHALPKSEIRHNDLQMIEEGFSQPTEVIVAVCLLVGFIIALIVLYTATTERARDLAVLKAVGANARFLITVSVIQSILLSINGFIAGLVMAKVLVWGFATFRPVIESYVTIKLVGGVLVLLVIVNLVALILPARFLLRVDPQEVFKA